MMLFGLAIVAGLALLVWSADRFVLGASVTARYLGWSPLIIGMVVVGFGTSAPELTVSALAAWQGQSGLALGNAVGSNITNIALILGVTALISPIAVQSRVLRIELPVLVAVTLLTLGLLLDGVIDRKDALALLLVFAALIGWMLWQAGRTPEDPLADVVNQDLAQQQLPVGRAVFWLVVGLVVLVLSSRLLVWGAVSVATRLGVSDLVIGLTIVAIGTSLPELASSILAARRGEHDLALGNVLGSNLFNILAVLGLAGLIRPLQAEPVLLSRDAIVLVALTLALFLLGMGRRGKAGRINRWEGSLLLAVFVGYTLWLVVSA
ncbi:calcium/sodium antiporter [Saccharospirillum sp. MSK14-1]|uniref:calcium/sodium antiporter n=1 Tax=Saccharospirillum sp. MSK14-1 TaxID=1897632 RepID=UPI000D33DC73|nr:calcium/sodium antiporter [Saccharospirillum sp. MSK14-1]PTY38091.1 calcium/sodium antiporter [Saccharospirillum sp. MSK14-1]